MADIITIEECITRLDAIRHEIVSNSRDHFALSAGIAALYEMEKDAPAVNRWIPCSERLPDRFDSVLLAILSRNGYGDPAYYVTIGGMKNGNEFESYTGDICEGEKVTHWMPLPEPPEKE